MVGLFALLLPVIELSCVTLCNRPNAPALLDRRKLYVIPLSRRAQARRASAYNRALNRLLGFHYSYVTNERTPTSYTHTHAPRSRPTPRPTRKGEEAAPSFGSLRAEASWAVGRSRGYKYRGRERAARDGYRAVRVRRRLSGETRKEGGGGEFKRRGERTTKTSEGKEARGEKGGKLCMYRMRESEGRR